MIAYVYRINDNIIVDKIYNVKETHTDSNDNTFITGDTVSKTGSSCSFIILDEDTINKNIGDLFEKDHLIDRKSDLELSDYEIMMGQIGTINNFVNSLSTDFQSFMDYVTTNVSGLSN